MPETFENNYLMEEEFLEERPSAHPVQNSHAVNVLSTLYIRVIRVIRVIRAIKVIKVIRVIRVIRVLYLFLPISLLSPRLF